MQQSTAERGLPDMPRKIDDKRFRLVITGNETIENIHCESIVMDDDMMEEPQRRLLENVDTTSPIGQAWGATVSTIKQLESIS